MAKANKQTVKGPGINSYHDINRFMMKILQAHMEGETGLQMDCGTPGNRVSMRQRIYRYRKLLEGMDPSDRLENEMPFSHWQYFQMMKLTNVGESNILFRFNVQVDCPIFKEGEDGETVPVEEDEVQALMQRAADIISGERRANYPDEVKELGEALKAKLGKGVTLMPAPEGPEDPEDSEDETIPESTIHDDFKGL